MKRIPRQSAATSALAAVVSRGLRRSSSSLKRAEISGRRARERAPRTFAARSERSSTPVVETRGSSWHASEKVSQIAQAQRGN